VPGASTGFDFLREVALAAGRIVAVGETAPFIGGAARGDLDPLVIRLHNGGPLLADGFESGGTAEWSAWSP
jgi:hypothetical protein